MTLKPINPTPPPPRLLKISDVAQRLGVSPATVTRWIEEGVLPCVRIPRNKNRMTRIKESDLEAFLQKHYHRSTS